MQRTQPDVSPGSAPTSSERSIAEAIDRYSRSMLQSIGGALVVAIVLYGAQALIAALHASDLADESAPRIPYPEITGPSASTAVTLLVTVAVALQVFLRLPRDPERYSTEDGIAHRQFWGTISSAVALGSALVTVYTAVGAITAIAATGVVDLPRVFGIPFGAVVALVFASDAVSLVADESRSPLVVDARRTAEEEALTAVINKVRRRARKRATHALVGGFTVWGLLAVLVCTALTRWLLGNPGMAGAYLTAALVSTTVIFVASGHSAVTALRGRILECLVPCIGAGLVVLLFAMQIALIGFPHVPDPDEPTAYMRPMAAGLLVGAPGAITVFMFTALPWRKGHEPPMIDHARAVLIKQRARVKESNKPEERKERWEVVAWASIWLSIVPLVSVFLVDAARRGRREATQTKTLLFTMAWLVPVVVLGVEIAAVLLLPVYGSELGWFTVP